VDNSRLIDKGTGDTYYKDDASMARLKCLGCFFATPVVHSVGLVLNIINKVGKLVSFAYFWVPSTSEHYNFKARLTEMGKDILRIALSPLILVGLLLAAAYGATISPNNGTKIYGALERFTYAGAYQRFIPEFRERELQVGLFALCFQPESTTHLGGGKGNNAF